MILMREAPESLARLHAYRCAHPDADISHAGGLWRAWIPRRDGDPFEGTEVRPDERLDVVLDRLDRLG